MIGFVEGYFIVFGGLALLGTVAAIYFYLQDRKEEHALEDQLISGSTLLNQAAIAGHSELVKLLIKPDAPPIKSEANRSSEVISSDPIKSVEQDAIRESSPNGDWLKAAEYFEKSLMLAEAIGDSQGRALVLRNLGKLCAKQGKIAEARNLFDKALSIYETLGDKLSIVRVYNELGLLFSHSLTLEENPVRIEN